MAGSDTILHQLRVRLARSPLWLVVLGVMVVTLAGCATKPGHHRREVEMDRVTFTFDESEEFDLFEQYEIQPGDLLDVLYQIKTWEEKKSFNLAVDNQISVKFPNVSKMNETQRIRPDGKITLPYLGDLYVVDMTIGELTAMLKEKYAGILKDPELYVIVREFRSAIKELKADLHTAPRGLSRLVTVRPDGYCTFSMIGDVYVAGRTIPEVNQVLNGKYGEVLPGLTVDLFLERHEGSVVYIMGEVENPGAHKIMRPTSIVKALALAGNALPSARLSSVVVVRKDPEEEKLVGTRVNVRRVLGLRRNAKLFYLKPDDIMYVPKRPISEWADVMNDLKDVLWFRGWGIGLTYGLDEGETLPEATAEAIVGP